ncbi:hypothetical protein Ancab_012127 [Ancistrocladus abbreviatus]
MIETTLLTKSALWSTSIEVLHWGSKTRNPIKNHFPIGERFFLKNPSTPAREAAEQTSHREGEVVKSNGRDARRRRIVDEVSNRITMITDRL